MQTNAQNLMMIPLFLPEILKSTSHKLTRKRSLYFIENGHINSLSARRRIILNMIFIHLY